MGYLVVPNFYAPKCAKFIDSDEPVNIHAFSYDKCNFNCDYCIFSYRQKETIYRDYDEHSFVDKVTELLPKGTSFKFTGGEPTLDPHFISRLSKLRNLGATIYVDSNASNKKVLKDALDRNLIDVLGVSLKGLTREEAQAHTKIKNSTLCWENVLETIAYASRFSSAEVIVTYVCYADFTPQKLHDFATILEPYPKVYLKINNYQEDHRITDPCLRPKDVDELEGIVETYLDDHPQWRGRTILITGPNAVQKFSAVELL